MICKMLSRWEGNALREADLSLFCRMPTLSTKRLVLRQILIGDADDVFDYSKREETSKYLLWSPHPTVGFTRKYLSYLQGQYRRRAFYDFALVDKKSGRIIGTCGFTSFDLDNNSAEVGYVLSPDFWGQGLAAEALSTLMHFGFWELSLHRLTARILEGNSQSVRVAEKCGFRHEATHRSALMVKGEFRTVLEYAVLRSEWLI